MERLSLSEKGDEYYKKGLLLATQTPSFPTAHASRKTSPPHEDQTQNQNHNALCLSEETNL